MIPGSGENGHGKDQAISIGNIYEAVLYRGTVPGISESFCGIVSGWVGQSPLSENAGDAQSQAGIREKIWPRFLRWYQRDPQRRLSQLHPALKGFAHEHRSYDPGAGLLHWLHIVISNAKAFILGTYHGLPKKHHQSYLDAYSFRFSRRCFGKALIERLVIAIGTSCSAKLKG